MTMLIIQRVFMVWLLSRSKFLWHWDYVTVGYKVAGFNIV